MTAISKLLERLRRVKKATPGEHRAIDAVSDAVDRAQDLYDYVGTALRPDPAGLATLAVTSAAKAKRWLSGRKKKALREKMDLLWKSSQRAERAAKDAVREIDRAIDALRL